MSDVICFPLKANEIIRIYDQNGKWIDYVQPIPWPEGLKYQLNRGPYQLCFIPKLPGLSLNVFKLKIHHGQPVNVNAKAIGYGYSKRAARKFGLRRRNTPRSIHIDNGDLKISVDPQTGLIDSIIVKDEAGGSKRATVRAQLMTYGTTRKSGDQSGAYLFIADKRDPEPMVYNPPKVRVIKGPLTSIVETLIHGEVPVKVVHKLTCGSTAIKIDLETDLSKMKEKRNMDFLIRFQTSIQNSDLTFYTDSNGFQVCDR